MTATEAWLLAATLLSLLSLAASLLASLPALERAWRAGLSAAAACLSVALMVSVL